MLTGILVFLILLGMSDLNSSIKECAKLLKQLLEEERTRK